MVDVGGANQRDAFPGIDENRPAVRRVQKGERLCDRQLPGGEDQVAAAQRAQLGGAPTWPRSRSAQAPVALITVLACTSAVRPVSMSRSATPATRPLLSSRSSAET